MTKPTIQVNLNKEEKSAVLEYTDFFIRDEQSKAYLNNKRKKWIHFTLDELTEVIGELSYYFNHCKSDYQFHFLDQLICHLEYYERLNKE